MERRLGFSNFSTSVYRLGDVYFIDIAALHVRRIIEIDYRCTLYFSNESQMKSNTQ